MRFLIDEDVYQITIDLLVNEGHDVIPVKQVGLERASDFLLLRKAKEMERIFVTRDKDFGSLVFLEGESSCGVILMRGTPSEIESIHSGLSIVLKSHSENELKRSFCVVEPGRYRLRKLKK